MQTATVAFIGLGAMGLPMATNLAKSGLTVHGFDPNKDAEDRLRTAGGTVGFPDAKSAAEGTDVALTSLPNVTVVEAALTADDGILAASQRPGYVVDLSTIAPGDTRRLAAEAAGRGVQLVDAPVSGSSRGAEAATLTVMVGAEPAAFAAVLPVLNVIGKNIIHVGPVGSGELIKLINNLLAGINVAAVAEAHSIAAKAGIDMKVAFDVISSATGSSWAFNNRFPEKGIVAGAPVDDDHAPGFAANLMAKDLELARQLSTEVGSPMLLGGVVQQLYAGVAANGWGDKDFGVISKLYQQLSAQS